MINLAFTNRYLNLGDAFYEKIKPTPVRQPGLIRFNHDLAAELGISGALDDAHFVADIFSGNLIHDSCESLAMAYAGHQFGQFNPQLGDGRAIYLGELAYAAGGSLDVQLKGSGRTRYSRSGDGRAALGPVLREYLVSEAMHRLGVPTTRALAAVTTGEQVRREHFPPGAVITRVASSFIRVGSFQYFSSRGDHDSLRKLADYVIERNYPDARAAQNPYLALFEAVVLRQARLIAQWMHLGFIHGVMNTDNMSIAGETIDYGPCAFMDFYSHTQVYSSIDHQGRYAYSNQPSIGLWNLTRLAETLLSLLDDNRDVAVSKAQDILQNYIAQYESAWLEGMRAKCGLTPQAGVADEDDRALLEALLNTMAQSRADFTQTFYYLSQLNAVADEKDAALRDVFMDRDALSDWLARWRQRLALGTRSDAERQSAMRAVNPVYIPRNHQIEAAIRAAEDHNDFSVFHALHEVLQNPFEVQPGKERYFAPPLAHEVVEQTFCGT